ncbi:MAG: DUF4178 domain-containing protein [Gammaproteobacteria bacterium]|nr:DUF4178 domain-containing protein [Gammaproteobacteria bacterium]
MKSIACGYCGSVLDAQDEYKVLRQFIDVKRPTSPLKIGMTGTLKGVDFTVIGIVQYRTTDYYYWIEAQLFSPTHGYAWLEYEGGHFVFSRRVRDRPATRPGIATKSVFKARGRSFRVYEHYSAEMTFVEGELTFIAKQGDKVSITDGMDPPYVFSVEKTSTEEEYHLGEYLDPKEAFEAFDIEGEPAKRRTVHAAQPYQPHSFFSGMSDAAKYFAPISLVFAILIWLMGGGSTVLDERLYPDKFLEGARTKSFSVSDADHLLRLDLKSGLQNAWAWFDVTILKDDQPVYSMAKEISYYSGTEGGEHWSEGSQSADAYFKLPQAGEYILFVDGEGGQGDRGNNPQHRALHIKIKEGVTVSRYFFILAVPFFVAFGLRYFMKWRFEAKRWQVVTGDD